MAPLSPTKPLPITVAYQGEPGSFSEQATLQFHALHFATRPISLLPCATFRDMFDSLSSGRATRLAVPIENSLAGTIHENLDLLLRARDADIVGELDLAVRHCLLAPPGMKLKDIKQVHSHPMALAQCTAFLERHGLTPQVGYDTAGCAKRVAKEGRGGFGKNEGGNAAIASAHAAKIYNLEVVEEDIQDVMDNYTRFLFVANRNFKQLENENEIENEIDNGEEIKMGVDGGKKKMMKSSIAFSLINQPGILCRALSVFAVSNIDLSKIESRPLHTVRRALGEDVDNDCDEKRWGYVFFVDILRHAEEDAVKAAFNHLQQITTFYRLLGSYPANVSTTTTSATEK